MRARFIDIALASAGSLLAAVAIWLSATGIESFSLLIVSVAISFIVILIGLAWLVWRDFVDRSAYPAALGTATILTIIVSVTLTQWPLRITYSLSRSAFDSVAQTILEGKELSMPQRVGLFVVRKAEVSHDGIVCLWTKPAPGGNTGFVQCKRSHVPFNLWSMVKLDDGWQFIAED
jgi:hypothetical protein